MVDQWGPQEHLLAHIGDLHAAGNWQRSGDAKAARPKPIPRPGNAVVAEDRRDTLRERAMALRARTQQRQVTYG